MWVSGALITEVNPLHRIRLETCMSETGLSTYIHTCWFRDRPCFEETDGGRSSRDRSKKQKHNITTSQYHLPSLFVPHVTAVYLQYLISDPHHHQQPGIESQVLCTVSLPDNTAARIRKGSNEFPHRC